jgi:flagellar motor protein MotB
MISRRKRSGYGKSPDSENPYWVTFSDLMAGLLVIFILALVTMMIQQKKKTQELSDQKQELVGKIIEIEEAEKAAKDAKTDAERAKEIAKEAIDTNTMLRETIVESLSNLSRTEKVRIEIITEIVEKLKARGISVEISDNYTVVRIPEEELSFATAKWDIPLIYKIKTKWIGNAIYDAITNHDRLDYIDTIFIEGHTDSVPLDRDMGNWGLSTYRAISVWNFWGEQDGPSKMLSQLRNHEDRPVFSVSGYGDTRRVIVNDNSDSARRKNRRIDIRFTMKSIGKGDLEQIIKQFE